MKNYLFPSLITTVSLLFCGLAFAAPPHQPNMVATGNLWKITGYADASPGHPPLATQPICFFPMANFGTHQRYVWVGLGFLDWNGWASQEGDQVTMHGDFPYPLNMVNTGHDTLKFEIATLNLAAGHWTEWVENATFGENIGFANAVAERVGECPYTSPQEALNQTQHINSTLRNPMGVNP